MGCIFLIAEEQVMTDIKVTLIRPSSDIRKCPKPFETFIDRDGGETEIHFFPCDIKILNAAIVNSFLKGCHTICLVESLERIVVVAVLSFLLTWHH